MSEAEPLQYGLPETAVYKIQETLAKYEEIARATLYGSRAKGNWRSGSDIDLTLHVKSDRSLSLLHHINQALEDLYLPWTIDLSFYAEIKNKELLGHIDRVGLEFYNSKEYQVIKQEKRKKRKYAKSARETEKQLENKLIAQLEILGFEKVRIDNEDALVANLKLQLENHNQVSLSGGEFRQVLNKLARGNIFEKAKILRDKVDYTREDGTTGYLELINPIKWCKNEYQVTHQVTMEGKYQNRYDVTLLINGFPLVQIELKRRGLELKEAFNQTNRYHRHSFSDGYGLFGYIQVFVISNGVNTKYYANNPVNKRDFKQTFFGRMRATKKLPN